MSEPLEGAFEPSADAPITAIVPAVGSPETDHTTQLTGRPVDEILVDDGVDDAEPVDEALDDAFDEVLDDALEEALDDAAVDDVEGAAGGGPAAAGPRKRRRRGSRGGRSRNRQRRD